MSDAQSSTFSAAHFERYALELLRAEAQRQGRPFFTGNEVSPDLRRFDAFAPAGILDIDGPTVLEVKRGGTIGVIEPWAQNSLTQLPAPVHLLLVTDQRPSIVDRLQSSLSKTFKSRVIRVLGHRDVEALARRHPDAALPFRQDALGPALDVYKRSSAVPDRTQQLEVLRKALREDRLTLFLGAGVSASAKLPSWNELLKRVALRLFETSLPSGLSPEEREEVFNYFQAEAPSSPLIVARLLRDSFGDRFPEHVQAALYEDMPEESTSELLRQVGAMCMPGRERRGLPAVVSYNFDELLEAELRRRLVSYKVILSDMDEALPSELPVYHVHGFLPRGGNLEQKHRVALVLSEEAYHSQFADPYLWSNIVQLNLMRNHVCLFVGLSMNDPNIRRLLEITLTKKPSVRHHAIFVDHWRTSAPRTASSRIEGLPEVFRGLEEASLTRLGVTPIWVESYREVPQVLAQIREV